MVNGIVYDFEALKVMLPTGLVILSESISYSDKKDDEVVSGYNNLPAGIGGGEYSGECELELGKSEYDKLNAFSAGSGGFYNMPPIPVIASYGHAGQAVKTDTLMVHFTERKFGGSKGDKSLNVTIKGPLTLPLNSDGIPAFVPM
jgi:hypothetical protein